MFTIYNGDCLEELNKVDSNSIDLVLTDPPYGTTAANWDSVLPFDAMWEQLNRVAKRNAAIVLFASQPFTTHLISSNLRSFRYCWYWKKNRHSNPFLAKYQPLRIIEELVVFYRAVPTYNMELESTYRTKSAQRSELYRGKSREHVQTETGYPKNVLEFDKEAGFHPTQKPVSLLERIIKTYTNPGDTVLDFTMGSGSTGVACRNVGRKFIGIEMSEQYCSVARQRIMSNK